MLFVAVALSMSMFAKDEQKIKKDKPSTVIQLSDTIKVIREGKIPSKTLIKEYQKL